MGHKDTVISICQQLLWLKPSQQIVRHSLGVYECGLLCFWHKCQIKERKGQFGKCPSGIKELSYNHVLQIEVRRYFLGNMSIFSINVFIVLWKLSDSICFKL